MNESILRCPIPEHRTANIAAYFATPGDPRICIPRYPTGIAALDDALQGGFAPGLHAIGAISSLGKSTLMLQIADNMSEQNIPVVMVSLEMDAISLTAKLISRHSYQIAPALAQLSTTLMSPKAAELPPDAQKVVRQAIDIVQSRNITILSNTGMPIGVAEIAEYMEWYRDTYQAAPVLIIDYLQLLAPPPHMRTYTDKQLVDYNISRLRAIALEYQIPILLISSLSRSSYGEAISLQSFKDSGSIEYSCDTLLGLQLRGVGTKGMDEQAAKARDPREVELVVIKQRYGPVGAAIRLNFRAMYSCFTEVSSSASVGLPGKRNAPFAMNTRSIPNA